MWTDREDQGARFSTACCFRTRLRFKLVILSKKVYINMQLVYITHMRWFDCHENKGADAPVIFICILQVVMVPAMCRILDNGFNFILA